MTREVVGLDPAPGPGAAPQVEFDLGELSGSGPAAPGPQPAAGLPSGRLRGGPVRPWVAVLVAAVVGLVAALAGWQAGGSRRQSALEAAALAHPAVFAWVVDGGPTLASAPDDPRVTVNLHLTNLSPDPMEITSVGITTDESNATVAFDGYQPAPIAPDDNTIAQLVARPTCTSNYDGAFLTVTVTRLGADGSRRRVSVPAGDDGRIGDTLGDILDKVCVYPTRDDPASGVDGLVIDQSAGPSGATVTITNHSNGLRQVQVSADDGPAFQLVGNPPAAVLMTPRDVLVLHLSVRVRDCASTYQLRDWATSVVLDVVRRGETLDPSATTDADVHTGFGLPDLMLVPGGAAIQRACG